MVQVGIIQSVASVSSVIPSPLRNEMIGSFFFFFKQLNNASPDGRRVYC